MREDPNRALTPSDLHALEARVTLLERLLGPSCESCGGTGLLITDVPREPPEPLPDDGMVRIAPAYHTGTLWAWSSFMGAPRIIRCGVCKGLGRELLDREALVEYLTKLKEEL
jgi:hypothetical protein